MRWLFRFSVYFLRPIIIALVIGYFSFLSVKAVAYSVSSYMRAERKAERAERAKALKAEKVEGEAATAPAKAKRKRTRRAEKAEPVTEQAPQDLTGRER